jgi:hypothetical protein
VCGFTSLFASNKKRNLFRAATSVFLCCCVEGEMMAEVQETSFKMRAETALPTAHHFEPCERFAFLSCSSF